MAIGAFTIPTIFTAVDKFTRPVNNIKKGIKDVGVEAARSERKFRKFNQRLSKFGTIGLAVGTAILAPLVLATKQAVEFEDRMADVGKVTGVKTGSAAFSELSKEVRQTSIFLAKASTDVAGLYANLAAGGVELENLTKVANIAGMVSVAFGITAEQAGNDFIKTRNALGGTIEETQRLMDTINFLSDTVAAKAPEILTFMANAGSGVARAANASGESVAAFGASLISVGTSAEESATVMERFIKVTLTSDKVRKVFDKAGGGAAGMLEVIRKGSKLAGKQQDQYFQQFGAYGIKLQLLAKNFEFLEKNVKDASNAQLTLDSVQKEFDNRSNTTLFRVQQQIEKFKDLGLEIGDKLLPIFNKLLDAVIPYIDKMLVWIDQNPELVRQIAVLAFWVGSAALVLGGLAKVLAIVNALMYANPVGLVIIGIMALIALIAIVIKKYEKWGAALAIFLGPLGLIINVLQSFRRHWDGIVNAFKTEGILAGFKKIGLALIDSVLYPIQQLFKLVNKIPGVNLKIDSSIEKLREKLGIDVGATSTDNTEANSTQNGSAMPLLSTMAAQQSNSMSIEKQIQRTLNEVNINVNGNKDTKVDSSNLPKGVNLSTTMTP